MPTGKIGFSHRNREPLLRFITLLGLSGFLLTGVSNNSKSNDSREPNDEPSGTVDRLDISSFSQVESLENIIVVNISIHYDSDITMKRMPLRVWKAMGKAMMNLKAAVIAQGRFRLRRNSTKVVKSSGKTQNPTPPTRRAENVKLPYNDRGRLLTSGHNASSDTVETREHPCELRFVHAQMRRQWTAAAFLLNKVFPAEFLNRSFLIRGENGTKTTFKSRHLTLYIKPSLDLASDDHSLSEVETASTHGGNRHFP